jgi:acetolactate synthase-1/2/3 large subunit
MPSPQAPSLERASVDESTANRTGGSLLAERLREHGVDIVFGQSAPIALHLAVPKFGMIDAQYRTENAGGAMADGYARISRRVGVVTAQNGPAAALLVAPLAEAYKVSIPIVALIQDVPTGQNDKNAFQELDHVQLFSSCAKWIRRVDSAARLGDYLDMAFLAASSGRCGPAVLIIPNNMLDEPASDWGERKCAYGSYPRDRMLPDPERIEAAADLLATAARPVIIAGGGVHVSGACDALARLQEDCHLPVATTTMGKGTVAETHPLSIGVTGNFMALGSRSHNLATLISEADVVLLVGNRTNQNGTDNWTLYPPAARYVHIDVDPMEIGRNYATEVRLVGDARLTLEALRAALLRRDMKRRQELRPAVEAKIRKAVSDWRRTTRAVCTSESSPIRPERIMAEIDALLTPDTIVVADASYSSIWITNFLTASKPGTRFITPRGLAGLGWGMPLAVGAKFASPGSPVICVTGDGGFAHVWGEMEILKRHKLPMCIVVLNNQGFAYQRHVEDTFYGDHTQACDFEPVDHAAVARACGLNGIRIDRAQDLASALKAALTSGVATLLDVMSDPAARAPVNFFKQLPSQY